jgi:hypothetical protein
VSFCTCKQHDGRAASAASGAPPRSFRQSFIARGSNERHNIAMADAPVDVLHLLYGLAVGNDAPVTGADSLRR